MDLLDDKYKHVNVAIASLCSDLGYSLAQIKSDADSGRLLTERVALSKSLRIKGFSADDISNALNQNMTYTEKALHLGREKKKENFKAW